MMAAERTTEDRTSKPVSPGPDGGPCAGTSHFLADAREGAVRTTDPRPVTFEPRFHRPYVDGLCFPSWCCQVGKASASSSGGRIRSV